MLDTPVFETEPHSKETLWRKLWPTARRPLAQKARLWERRQSYRLPLSHRKTVQVAVKPESGPVFKSVLHDLSAGGFSCLTPLPEHLTVNSRVRIRLRLPDDEPLMLETEAVFLDENRAEGDRRIGRFRFTSALTEDQRDRLHEFILKAQFQALRKQKVLA